MVRNVSAMRGQVEQHWQLSSCYPGASLIVEVLARAIKYILVWRGKLLLHDSKPRHWLIIASYCTSDFAGWLKGEIATASSGTAPKNQR